MRGTARRRGFPGALAQGAPVNLQATGTAALQRGVGGSLPPWEACSVRTAHLTPAVAHGTNGGTAKSALNNSAATPSSLIVDASKRGPASRVSWLR